MKSAIKANWEAYHYCLAQSPNVELSIGRYLTWLITRMVKRQQGGNMRKLKELMEVRAF